jgi:hypothetical protein
MNRSLHIGRVLRLGLIIFLSVWSAGVVRAEDLNLKCLLIWATNDESSPNPKHKEISPELDTKLRATPYKWKHYFEVHQTNVVLHSKELKKIEMSKHCLLEATNRNDGRIQLNLYGEGKPVSKHTEPLPPGQIVILSGPSKNDTGWLVLIQRLDPKNDHDAKAEHAK